MVIKATPQILKRISIRWLPDPAYEDTETIALNVGGYFMDLRVTRVDNRLQWSRAGERKKLEEKPLTFQWTRIIDSLGSTRPDEASFAEMDNGDDLETGTFNKDGTPTEYEEVWRDVTGKAGSDDGAWILQSINGFTFLGKIDDIFLGMQQGGNGSFGVRKEVYGPAKGDWKIAFKAGPTQHIPRVVDVLRNPLFDSLLKTNGTTVKVGTTIRVRNSEYVIRAFSSSNA